MLDDKKEKEELLKYVTRDVYRTVKGLTARSFVIFCSRYIMTYMDNMRRR